MIIEHIISRINKEKQIRAHVLKDTPMSDAARALYMGRIQDVEAQIIEQVKNAARHGSPLSLEAYILHAIENESCFQFRPGDALNLQKRIMENVKGLRWKQIYRDRARLFSIHNVTPRGNGRSMRR